MAKKHTPVGSNGKLHGKRAPRNKIANESYNKKLGELLAEYEVLERKSANFGSVTTSDKYNDLWRLPRTEGYNKLQRKDIYQKALRHYDQHEIVRSAINLLVSATFSRMNRPDFAGSRSDLIELVQKIIEHNQINFHDWGKELELAGDAFLWFSPNGDQTEIRSLDAAVVDVELVDDNIRRVRGYKLKDRNRLISSDKLQHLKLHGTSTELYGSSTIRPIFYWIDVLDSLFENNWLRGAQYYGNPLIAVTGVPGPFQATIKSQIEGQLQRAGRSWVLPPDSDIKTPDFSLNFPINEIVSWVFRIITISLEIPITLLGTADASSRGSAFFANPRFNLAINLRREVWRIGLRNLFIKIFKEVGVLGKNDTLTRKEFDVNFAPIFDKDLSDVAKFIKEYMDRGLLSKKSARELVGFDHTDEEEQIAQEEPYISPLDQRKLEQEDKRIDNAEKQAEMTAQMMANQANGENQNNNGPEQAQSS